MHTMDIMTTNVITVRPETSVQELAVLLAERGISGVPVVDADNRVVGIVSEGDLLHRAETGTARRTQRRRTRWLDGLAGDPEPARDYIKAHGRKVSDIMTRDVVSVSENTDLSEVADLLETNKIKRVPVLRDGKLCGIVSRANLVRALAAAPRPATSDADDRTIRSDFLAELDGHRWANVWAADIVVHDRVVHLWFADDQPLEERRAILVAAENIRGVRGVEQHLVPAPIAPSF